MPDTGPDLIERMDLTRYVRRASRLIGSEPGEVYITECLDQGDIDALIRATEIAGFTVAMMEGSGEATPQELAEARTLMTLLATFTNAMVNGKHERTETP